MELRLIEFAMTLIAQELNVKLYDGKTARGRLYTIDPINGSLILKNFIVYDENGKLV
jgi:small nuclear ribonucleoprotein (snRNP)-like protein